MTNDKMETLLTALTENRKAELHDYAKVGQTFDDIVNKTGASLAEVYAISQAKEDALPFSQISIEAMIRLHKAHPGWSESTDNVDIKDLTSNELAMLESVALSGLEQMARELGISDEEIWGED